MNYPASIPKLFEQTVNLCRPVVLPVIQENTSTEDRDSAIEVINYQYGTVNELQETLDQMKDGADISKRFPLIWLIEPITEDRTNTRGFYADVSLNIVIAYNGNPDRKSYQKETEVYDPILRPVYWELLEAIGVSPWFCSPDPRRRQPHRKVDSKNWSDDNNITNVLSTTCDGIAILDLGLTIDYEQCLNQIF